MELMFRSIGWLQVKSHLFKTRDRIVLAVGLSLQPLVLRAQNLSLTIQTSTFLQDNWLIALDPTEIVDVRVVMWIMLTAICCTMESQRLRDTHTIILRDAIVFWTPFKSQIIQLQTAPAQASPLFWHLSQYRWVSMRPIGRPIKLGSLAIAGPAQITPPY